MILGGGILRNKSIENFFLGYIIKRENKYFCVHIAYIKQAAKSNFAAVAFNDGR
jgi:hypothetical protein